jgi:penicillin-binding protein 1A
MVCAACAAALPSCSSSKLPDALREFTDLSKVQLPEHSNPSRIFSADGTELGQVNMEDRKFVALDEMADCMPEAFVAIEDERFYKHGGVDARGVLRAVWRAVSRGKAKEGASTITMQLARNLYLTQEKTLQRKTEEALIAAELERRYSKDEILEAYLNVIYFGHGAYGVGAASDLFFGKPPHKLETHECAMLAAIVKGPAVYSPHMNRDNALARRNLVLKKMLDTGAIDEQEQAHAKKQPLRVLPYSGPYENFRAAYFVDYVIHQLTSDTGPFGFSARELATGGYQIYTTLDWSMQSNAEAAVRGAAAAAGLKLLPSRDKSTEAVLQYALNTDVKILGLDSAEAATRYSGSGLSQAAIKAAKEQAGAAAPQGAFVAVDAWSGAVLAMVGGADSKTSRYNRAWLSARQAGSSFKPFVYLTALMQGHSMADTVENSRYCIGGYCPKNYGGSYGDGALVTWHEALVKSLNIPAVRVGHRAGERNIIALCRKLGLDADMEPSAPLSLGAASASPLQMAAAYAAIANGGSRVRPYAINVIRDAKGNVIFRKDHSQGEHVLDPAALRSIIPAMEDVIRRGTGRAARIGHIAAGKTGTTSSYRDAWFVGFTPDIAAAAWIGHDNNAPLCPPNTTRGCITGGLVPAALWRDVMESIKPQRYDFNLPPAQAVTEPADPDAVELTGEEDPDANGQATPTVIIDVQPVDGTEDDYPVEDTGADDADADPDSESGLMRSKPQPAAITPDDDSMHTPSDGQ